MNHWSQQRKTNKIVCAMDIFLPLNRHIIRLVTVPSYGP